MTDRLLTDGRLLLFKIENRERGRTLEELLADGAVKLAKITKRQRARKSGPVQRNRGRVVRI